MMRRSGFGWLESIIGIILIVLGIVALSNPTGVVNGFVIVCGIVAIIMGIADIIMYIRVEIFTGFGPMVSLISGILGVMAGVMLMAYPQAGSLVFAILFPIWFIAHCISRLSRLDGIRLIAGNGAYYCSLAMNIIGLLLGVLLIIKPWITIVSIGWIIGLYLILLGIESLLVAFSGMGSKY